jgi:hypothetical protein
VSLWVSAPVWLTGGAGEERLLRRVPLYVKGCGELLRSEAVAAPPLSGVIPRCASWAGVAGERAASTEVESSGRG